MVAAGESLSDNALALATYLFVVVGPGLLVTHRLRDDLASPFERLLLAWGSGVAVTVGLIFFGGALHPSVGVALTTATALAGWALTLRRMDLAATRARLRVDGPLLLMLPIVVVGVGRWVDIGFETPDGFALTGYYDHLLHTATLFEWGRGIPPQEMPHLAGEPWWPYHNGTDALAWVPFHVLGVSPFAAHDVALRGLAFVLAVTGLGVVTRRLSGSAWAGAAVMGLFVLPLGPHFAALRHLAENSPSAVALTCLPALLLALALHEKRASLDAATCVGLGAAALFLTKANALLFVGPGLALAGAVLVRDGRWRDAVAAAIAGAIFIVPTALYLSTVDVVRGPALGYGFFGEWAAGRGELLSHLAAGAPDAARPPLAVLLWIVDVGGLAWIPAVVALVVTLRRSARLAPWHAVVVGSTLSLLFLALFVIDENARQLMAWNIVLFLQHPLRFFVWVGAGVGIALLISWVPPAYRRAGPVVLLLLTGGVLVSELDEPSPWGGYLMPNPWLDAATYLRTETPLDAVVLTYANVWGATYTSGIAGRRVVVERPVLMFATFESTANRLADLEIIFGLDDAAVVHALLRERGVTHIVERRARPLALTNRAGLKVAFESGDVRVLHVERVDAGAVDAEALARLRAAVTARLHAILRVYTGEKEAAVAADVGVEAPVLHGWADRVKHRKPLADDLLRAFAP